MNNIFIKLQGIITILLISVIIAFVANFVSPNGISLIYSYDTGSLISNDLFVTLEQAKSYYQNSSALFLDSRTYEIYKRGHIKGSISFPYFEFEEYFKKLSSKLPKNVPLIIYCGGEKCNSSEKLAVKLIDKGYSNVIIFNNGWNQWKFSNLPIE